MESLKVKPKTAAHHMLSPRVIGAAESDDASDYNNDSDCEECRGCSYDDEHLSAC